MTTLEEHTRTLAEMGTFEIDMYKKKALADFLNVGMQDLELVNSGLGLFTCHGLDNYRVLTDEEADQAIGDVVTTVPVDNYTDRGEILATLDGEENSESQFYIYRLE